MRILSILGGMVVLAGGALAGDLWSERQPAEWTQEQALALLTDSPWAKGVLISRFTGRQVRVIRFGRPEIRWEVSRARYQVRWSSAKVVQEAWQRLRDMAPRAVVDLHGPPPELSSHHYVLTVQIAQPPNPAGSGLFHGLEDSELAERARLRTSQERSLKPTRALRYGLGAGQGISFFFLRHQNDEETLPRDAEWAEFVFEDRRGTKLEVKFDLHRMRIGDRFDY